MNAESNVPILIVNDDTAQRVALKAVLAPLGYAIVEAESGFAALRCVLEQDFAVILLDLRMPEMDGSETAGLLRQRRQSEMTPIIFITAFGTDEITATDLYAQGAVDFIVAPVPPDELRAKVSVFANLFINAAELATRAREVQRSADQLRLLTDSAPVGIFQTDAENRYVFTNPRWTEITGVPPGDALGERWEDIIGSGERVGLISDRGDPDVHPGELSCRVEIRVPDSTPRIVLVTSKSIPDREGGTAGWVGTLADVTAETEAEAALAAASDAARRATSDEENAPVAAAEPKPTARSGQASGRLLLATDNPIDQQLAVTVLQRAGYRVDAVPNSAPAVHAAAAQPYDAILMDCQILETNGYEATAAIRAHEGTGRHTPVVAMIAGAGREDRERCRAAGMDTYLSTPVNKDALLAVVARSVKNGRAVIAAMSRTIRPSAEEITIDPAVFDKLRVLGAAAGQDLLTELVEQFARDTGPLLIELRHALQSSDALAVVRIAHMIKGSSGQLGGRRLAASCDRLERNAATGSLADGSSDLHDIEVDYEVLRRAWTDQLGRNRVQPAEPA